MRTLAVSGLSAALAGAVVLAIYGAGAMPIISLGGLALVAGIFALIVARPQLAARREPKALPDCRED